MALIPMKYPDDFMTRFKELKIKQKLRFIVLKIGITDTDILIEHEGARDSNFNDMVGFLPMNEPRYVIFDVPVETDSKLTKLIFLFWTPGSSSPKHRMVYASAKDGVRNTCNGCHREVQITDLEDLTVEALRSSI